MAGLLLSETGGLMTDSCRRNTSFMEYIACPRRVSTEKKDLCDGGSIESEYTPRS